MLKDALKSLLALLFGPSFVSSAIGLVCAVIVEVAVQADKLPGYGWHLVALGLYALGRVVQDHFQKPAAPVQPVSETPVPPPAP